MERELRIGNYVNINGEIVKIDIKLFHAIIHGFTGYNPDPIPLTEDLVDKLGFENLVEMASYFCSESRYPIIINPEDLKAMKVHEAQNLFNDLTGEELTINE